MGVLANKFFSLPSTLNVPSKRNQSRYLGQPNQPSIAYGEYQTKRRAFLFAHTSITYGVSSAGVWFFVSGTL